MANVKTINDEVRIQALIDEKRVNIKESSIFRTLQLDDAEGTSCLANAKIFDGLANMGYEKLSEKLTFYKAFFSPQWKFLIHTILQCLSAKTTAWNEFSSTMASTIICLATNQKFNFSRVVTPLFNHMLVPAAKEVGLIQDDVQSISIPTEPSTSKPHKKHKPKKQQTQAPKVPSPEPSPEHRLPSPSNDPLLGVINIKSTYKESIEKLKGKVDRLEEENRVLKELHSVHSKVDTTAPVMKKEKSFKHGRIIADIDEDDVDDEEPAEVKEVLEVVTVAKLRTEVVTTAGATTTAEATKVSVSRRRKGVVIQDPEETTSTIVVHSKVQSKDKGKEEVNEEVTVPEKDVEVEGHKREGESLEKDITKKQKMDEEAEELKSHLQIVFNDDDDVYTEATPLASKIPIVDYKIHLERNKPYVKIIKADGNHVLFLSFSTLLKNFDREDLESLWKLVKERFEKIEPKNYTDEYLLKTLKKMFEQPDVKASIWRDQKGRYGLAKKYPLTHFTLEKMLSNVRFEVKE
nr:ribonuclease H-like domain-containing protein [Tanacetum cinerariifolium]